MFARGTGRNKEDLEFVMRRAGKLGVLHHGAIAKAGKLNRAFKARHLVLLDPGVLVYAEDDAVVRRLEALNARLPHGWPEEMKQGVEVGLGLVLGTVRVTGQTPAVFIGKHAGRDNVFTVRAMAPSARVFYFQTETRAAAEEWIAKIKALPDRPPPIKFPVVPTPEERRAVEEERRRAANPLQSLFGAAQPAQQQAPPPQQQQPQQQQQQQQLQRQQSRPRQASVGAFGALGGLGGLIMSQVQNAMQQAQLAQQHAMAQHQAAMAQHQQAAAEQRQMDPNSVDYHVEAWRPVRTVLGQGFQSCGHAPVFANSDADLFVEAWVQVRPGMFSKVGKVPLYRYARLDKEYLVETWVPVSMGMRSVGNYLPLPAQRPLPEHMVRHR